MYAPCSSVFTFLTWPVLSLFRVTVAVGITPPEASLIVPTMRATSVWLCSRGNATAPNRIRKSIVVERVFRIMAFTREKHPLHVPQRGLFNFSHGA